MKNLLGRLALGGALCLALGAGLAGCASASSNLQSPEETSASTESSGSLDLATDRWSYDADHDVYWQMGVAYCANPQATEYESLGIYVPGAYVDAEEVGDGTYMLTPSDSGTVNDYTAETAPIVMPVDTAGYSAQKAPTSYSYEKVADYLSAGCVYVEAGCRGRDNGENPDGTSFDGGAPWGVTDLKAAVRYLKRNASVLPGDTDAIYAFGMSGGGAQSVVLGASGNSELYDPYLEAIGAATEDLSGNPVGDEIHGVMGWCPITNLTEADAAYEWMMGQYADSGTRAEGTWTKLLSENLAEAFALYVNEQGFTANGEALTLEPSEEGVYAQGSYYNYVLGVVEQSLNDFLADTTFPYTESSSQGGPRGGAGGRTLNGTSDGTLPEIEDSAAPSDLPDGATPPDLPDGATRPDLSSGPSASDSGLSGGMRGGKSMASGETFETVQDYIDHLNEDVQWVTYDPSTNTATISNLAAFSEVMKPATKDVGAFDDLNLAQAENKVFGTGDANALHFDAILTNLLEKNASEYAEAGDFDQSLVEAYREGTESVDSLGVDSETRQNMYDPMYYLLKASEGYGTSDVAKVWRINAGISQGDTSVTTEVNLSLALQDNPDVQSTELTEVWAQGHTTAERTGTSTENFLAWVGKTTD